MCQAPTTHMPRDLIDQAPEIARGERFGFPADVFSFAITMYELFHRDLPYTQEERGVPFKLAMRVGQEAYRPTLNEEWDPSFSVLICS